MYIVFFSTNDVFKAEELLNEGEISCDIVPTPVQDKAYCGVCIKTKDTQALEVLKGLELNTIEEK